MKKKPFIILFLSFFIYLSGFSQDEHPISNKNIKYGAIRISSKFLDSNKFEPSRTYITVDLAQSTRHIITKFTYDEWMNLLNDSTTDWAANLCLYNIFKRDAEFFSLWQTREKWLNLGYFKKNEIKYWQNNLPQLLKEPLPEPPTSF